ncbi:mCG148330, isoform CRA_b, partial [Mus musculus]
SMKNPKQDISIGATSNICRRPRTRSGVQHLLSTPSECRESSKAGPANHWLLETLKWTEQLTIISVCVCQFSCSADTFRIQRWLPFLEPVLFLELRHCCIVFFVQLNSTSY